jgi:hypothetical protein
MDTTSAGELVKVGGDGPDLNGIVFDRPSRAKAVVAVVDPDRGPQFRTVQLSALTERTAEAPEDRALRLLIRRTPSPGRTAARGGTTGKHGSPGYARGTMHRTTGK